jgi:hypothetical protein
LGFVEEYFLDTKPVKFMGDGGDLVSLGTFGTLPAGAVGVAAS